MLLGFTLAAFNLDRIRSFRARHACNDVRRDVLKRRNDDNAPPNDNEEAPGGLLVLFSRSLEMSY